MIPTNVIVTVGYFVFTDTLYIGVVKMNDGHT